MRYSISRKLNLGRLANLQYESLDLTVEDCDSREQAMAEIKAWKDEIVESLQKAKDNKKKKEEEESPF